MKKIIITLVSILILLILAVVIFKSINHLNATSIQEMEMENIPDDAIVVNETLDITNDEKYFYVNGEVVTDEIRVKPNTLLNIEVINNSDYPLTLHFHGLKGLSKMDGVGGLTQDNIDPKESYTYEFYLDQPGTYMYHSHVDSVNQVNNELLFGGLVVEDEVEQEYANKEMLIFNTNINNEDAHHDAATSGDTVTVNGSSNYEYDVQNDEDIYLNIVNLSSAPISIDLGKDIEYQIKNVDANPVNSEKIKNKDLIIPTANRVEVLIENPQESFIISSSLNERNNASVVMNINGSLDVEETSYVNEEKTEINHMEPYANELLNSDSLYLYDVISNEEPLKTDANVDIATQEVTKEFELTLDANMEHWLINDQAFPNTDNIVVDEGDIVEITLSSNGHMSEAHPFHLHGHEFQVMKYNGTDLDKNIILDTVNVNPGEEITIRFEANNPGIWAFHCHDLTHAGKGMMTLLEYDGYYSDVEGDVEE